MYIYLPGGSPLQLELLGWEGDDGWGERLLRSWRGDIGGFSFCLSNEGEIRPDDFLNTLGEPLGEVDLGEGGARSPRVTFFRELITWVVGGETVITRVD